jgi:uncharacterized protein
MAGGTLGVLLISGAHDRAHAAFSLAAAAAALDRSVVLFATGAGLAALYDDWSGVSEVGRDVVLRRAGVHGLGELRMAAREAGVRMIACETALVSARALQAEPAAPRLWEGVERGGLADFLSAVGEGAVTAI